ncbi:hypothetical protein X975_21663, partial [Stegodyphus mimosarum]
MCDGMLYLAFNMRNLAESSNGCSLKQSRNKMHPKS